MWATNFPTTDSFVYSIFGIQYPTSSETPLEPQHTLITTFTTLLPPSTTNHIDKLIQPPTTQAQAQSQGQAQVKTQIWLIYWSSRTAYEEWWSHPTVTHFWSTLPDDAGMYRETLTIPRSRTQFATNKKEPVVGMGSLSCGKYVSVLDKSGYWGCYRDRIPEMRTDSHSLDSLEEAPSDTTIPAEGGIRYGRVKLAEVPENITFVVEGQDHSRITPEERKYWFENFNSLATQWMQDLATTTPAEGMIDARLCYDPDSGRFQNGQLESQNYHRKVQLFYILDFGHMLKLGMKNRAHVTLRRRFLAAYGPRGVMSEGGGIQLWVETSVLTAGGVDCEYVGCMEGTGLQVLVKG